MAGIGAVRNLDWMFTKRTADKLSGFVRCTNGMPLQMMAVACTKNEDAGNTCTVFLTVSRRLHTEIGAGTLVWSGSHKTGSRYAAINCPHLLQPYKDGDANKPFDYVFEVTSDNEKATADWVEVVVCPDRAFP